MNSAVDLDGRGGGKMRISFQTRLTSLDAVTGVATLQKGVEEEELPAADLVAGCDGVNSAVRSSIAAACPGFQLTETNIPGSFKVLRFPKRLVNSFFPKNYLFVVFCFIVLPLNSFEKL